MSEKRFTTKNIICSNYCVWDNNDKPYGNDEVVDLLNEQDEENEQLRQFINKGRRLSVKELMNNANENELLKKENRMLKKDLNKLYNLLMDKGMSHNELQDVLWGINYDTY